MEILDLYTSINIFSEFNFFSLLHFYNISFLSCMHFSIWDFVYVNIFSLNVQSHWSVPMVKLLFPSSFCFNLDSVCSCLWAFVWKNWMFGLKSDYLVYEVMIYTLCSFPWNSMSTGYWIIWVLTFNHPRSLFCCSVLLFVSSFFVDSFLLVYCSLLEGSRFSWVYSKCITVYWRNQSDTFLCLISLFYQQI